MQEHDELKHYYLIDNIVNIIIEYLNLEKEDTFKIVTKELEKISKYFNKQFYDIDEIPEEGVRDYLYFYVFDKIVSICTKHRILRNEIFKDIIKYYKIWKVKFF